MTHARSLTYRHLIKLGDVYDALQILEKKKKRKKTLIGNLPLPSPEQINENSIDTTSQSREQNSRNQPYKVLENSGKIPISSFGSLNKGEFSKGLSAWSLCLTLWRIIYLPFTFYLPIYIFTFIYHPEMDDKTPISSSGLLIGTIIDSVFFNQLS